MSNLFLILVIAFVVIVFAIAILAIGWLITGKTKIVKPQTQAPVKRTEESVQEVSIPQNEKTETHSHS